MRVEFAASMLKFFDSHPEMVFITGDLGYMALEQLQQKFGHKFINAGVAEQNMVTMAAAMAYEGFVPWLYSISPFVTIRPYEQIRNDACLHDLPVKIVGNGGGYGYGIMGATHHNIEDIGAMRVPPNMRIYVPFVAADVEQAVEQMLTDRHPNYLRLNMAAKISSPVAPFTQWRKIKEGSKGVVIGTGPVLENICNLDMAADLEIWVVSLFPINDIPKELMEKIAATKKVITIEEHNKECGLTETIAFHILQSPNAPNSRISYLPLSASGYPSGKYGDQKWHQAENNLAGDGLRKKVEAFI